MNGNGGPIPWFLLFLFAMGVAIAALALTHSPALNRPADCPVGIRIDEC